MFLIIFCLVIVIECTIPLKLQNLHIPSYVPLGARASLSCRWQLGPADVLYSVKWYKDGKEFFRHVPRDVEPRRKFPLPGVDVEEYHSSGSHIVLAPAVSETGGSYRCEVSGEGPLFLTVSEHADMSVAILPEHGPSLSGLKPKYRSKERLRVNCTSDKSRPPTHLAWYLNGEPVSDLAPSYWSENGLVTTRLILDFLVDPMHFRNCALKIKCLATIPNIYWRSNEQTAVLDESRVHERLDKRNTIPMRADKAHANSWNPGCSYSTKFLVCFGIFCNFMLLSYDN